MKTVFPSREIAHIWAHQTQPDARSNANDTVRGTAILHWSTVLARIIRPGVFVLDCASFSVTTSKRQSRISRAIPGDAYVFYVNCGRRGQQLDFTPVTLRDYYIGQFKADYDEPSRYERIRNQAYAHRLNQLETALRVCQVCHLGTARVDRMLAKAHTDEARARFHATAKARVQKRQQELKTAKAAQLARNIEQAKAFLADPAKFPNANPNTTALATLPEELRAPIQAILDERTKAIREQQAADVLLLANNYLANPLAIEPDFNLWELSEEMTERVRLVTKDRRTAQAIRKATEYIETPQLFGRPDFDSSLLPEEMRKHVEAIQTEKEKAAWEIWLSGSGTLPSGAWELPVRLRAVRGQMETSRGAFVPLEDARIACLFAMRHRQTGWHRNGETQSIGHYQLDAVNAQGVVAGCHRVSWEEIERFAWSQGWLA